MLTPNSNFKKRLWVADNFYGDPGGIIDFAWKQEYVNIKINDGEPEPYSQQQFLLPGIKDAFENIIGSRIVKWEISPLNGRFHINYTKHKPVILSQDHNYGGIIFLTHQLYHYNDGFNLLVHKETKNRYRLDSLDQNSMNDLSQFQAEESISYYINRLVLFDARQFHSIPYYFGEQTGEGWDGFLTQVFYFD